MFRNKGIQHFSILYCILSILAIAIGRCISVASGLLVMGICFLFGALFYLFTRKRYLDIAAISEEIDQVLHNAEHLLIQEQEEGELAILKSELVKMTIRIREQNEALQKDKQFLVDSMADIAHQLRTPLTSVNLILTLLERGASDNSSEVSAESSNIALIREAQESLSHMDWLLTSLLKLSKLDADIVTFAKDSVDVKQLLQLAIKPLLISMELHDISYTIQLFNQTAKDFPSSAITIVGDFQWLTEAIRNLIKNCMESIREQGLIEVTVTNTPIYTEITIHDSGSGFQAQDLPFLFDRFYRGKNSEATGYGIGLSLSRLIIVKQGGTITAKNHPQGGALFTIHFPKL